MCFLCTKYPPNRWIFCVSVRITFTLSLFGIVCLKVLLPLTIIWFKQWNKVTYTGWTYKSWQKNWSVLENFCLLYIPINLVKQRWSQWNSSGSFALLIRNKSMWTNLFWRIHLNNFKDMGWTNWIRNFSLSWEVRIIDDFHIKCRYQVNGIILS